jgi:hypothetical protein
MSLRGNSRTSACQHNCSAIALASVGERLLNRHLRRAGFLNGIENDCWRLVSLAWPHAIFSIGEKYSSPEGTFGVAFCLRGYPIQAPTMQLWNMSENLSVPAPDWPCWFTEFITYYYPGLVTLKQEPYSPELLKISSAIIRRLKQTRTAVWRSSGDLTQILDPLAECFFNGAQLPLDYPLVG